MTIEVTIKGLERDPQTGFVQILHGRFTAKKQDACLTESVTLFFYEEKDEFIPFQNLTKDIILGWIGKDINFSFLENEFQKSIDYVPVTGLPCSE